MIQELFSGVVMEDRKLSFPPSLFLPDTSTTSSTTSSPSNPSSPSPSPLPSSCSSSSSLTPASTTSSEPQRENLRCPRCDSSNTKFCYYNNYNLTQPRHFCKTCRRYWTKGGALRNVPIGGGCRKAKPSLPSSSSSSSKPKPKPIPSPEPNAHDLLRLPSSSPSSSPPLLWPSPPSQSSQLLALLRNSGMRNLSYSIPSLKEDGPLISSQLVGEPMAAFNPLTQLSQQQQQQQQQHCLLFGEAPSSGFQELYQKLARSTSSGYYCNSDHLQGMVSNVGSGTGVAASNCLASGLGSAMAMGPTSSAVLEPFPSPGGEFGYWNPAVAWPDLPTTTTNGAFP